MVAIDLGEEAGGRWPLLGQGGANDLHDGTAWYHDCCGGHTDLHWVKTHGAQYTHTFTRTKECT